MPLRTVRIACLLVLLAVGLPAQASGLTLSAIRNQGVEPASYHLYLQVPRGWSATASGSTANMYQVGRTGCRADLQVQSWDTIITSRRQPGARSFAQGWLDLYKPLTGVGAGDLRLARPWAGEWTVDPLGGWRVYLWSIAGQSQQLRATSGYRAATRSGLVWHQAGVLIRTVMSGRCPQQIPAAWKGDTVAVARSLQIGA